MNYLVKKKVPTGRIEILNEYPASSWDDAKEKFTDWLASYLVSQPGNRHICYLATDGGLAVDSENLEGPAVPVPEWYTAEGIYDQDHHLVLAYEYPEGVGNTLLESFTYQRDLLWVERERHMTSMEACEMLRITRKTLLRWVKRGHIIPIRQAEKPSTRKHLFSEREVLRVLNDLPPSAPLRRYPPSI